MMNFVGQVLLISNAFLLSCNAEIHLPSFDFGEDKVNEKDLRDDGYKIGAFVVKNLGNEYKTSVENFIAKAPNCLGQNSGLPKLGKYP